MILAVHPSLPATDVPDLIALATQRRLTYGSSSTASATFLAAALFQRLAGITMDHVLYGDTRLLYEHLLVRRLDLSINNFMTMLPLFREGRLRALGVTTAVRLAVRPEAAALAEAGLAKYAVSNWLRFVAPPGTPAAVVAVQNAALRTTLRSPAVAGVLAANGVEVVASSPDAFARHIAMEREMWSWVGQQVAPDGNMHG